MSTNVTFLQRPALYPLAYVYSEGTDPLVVFLGGYRSDMGGTKATYFEEQCRKRGQAYLRLDYGGHGQSGSTFDQGTIGDWARDAIDVINHVAGKERPVILAGSSMGGWMAFLVARSERINVTGLVGIAAAPDFTEDIYARLGDDLKADLERNGFAMVPNDYSDEPYRFTKSFYDEAKAHLVLGQGLRTCFPVTLIQGMLDKDVLPKTAAKIKEGLSGAETKIIYVEDGDHRLSRPQDLELIDREIQAICAYR